MTDKLTLKLNDSIVEITMDDNGRYCLNDLFKASGAPTNTKAPSQFLRYKNTNVEVVKVCEFTQLNSGISRPLPEDFESYVVLSGKGRGSKTFAPLKVVYKYAAFISKEFEDAVYSAFTSLSKGNVQEAANIASSVALTPEIVAKQQKVQKALVETIQKVYGADSKRYIHYFRLVSKAVTGYTPKNLTDGSKSAADWIIKDGHLPAMNALIATHKMVLSLLKAGVTDYHVIATALGVSTTENKKIIAEIDSVTN